MPIKVWTMTYEVWEPRRYLNAVSSTPANTFDLRVPFCILFSLGYTMSQSHVFVASIADFGGSLINLHSTRVKFRASLVVEWALQLSSGTPNRPLGGY